MAEHAMATPTRGTTERDAGRRAVLTIPVLVVLLVVFAAVGIGVGSVEIPLQRLISVLTGRAAGLPAYLSTIILQIRLPRVFMAVLIGMMLASSGTVVQAVFHNPLADPYIIGISASAVAGTVIAFLLDLPDYFYGVFAFVVSVAATFLIFRLSVRRAPAPLRSSARSPAPRTLQSKWSPSATPPSSACVRSLPTTH